MLKKKGKDHLKSKQLYTNRSEQYFSSYLLLLQSQSFSPEVVVYLIKLMQDHLTVTKHRIFYKNLEVWITGAPGWVVSSVLQHDTPFTKYEYFCERLNQYLSAFSNLDDSYGGPIEKLFKNNANIYLLHLINSFGEHVLKIVPTFTARKHLISFDSNDFFVGINLL